MEQQPAIQAYVAWCRKEREGALRQIDLFTYGSARALIQNGDGPPEDITARVLEHQHEIVKQMDGILSVLDPG